MKFVCPKCLKIAEIEPRSPEHEIISVYYLHRPSQILAAPALAGVGAGLST